MKRFVQFLGAATLLLSFTQCSEDATTDSAPSVQGSVKLTASINETRTELSGNDVLWKSNDRLGLFCGTKFVNAPFTTTAGGHHFRPISRAIRPIPRVPRPRYSTPTIPIPPMRCWKAASYRDSRSPLCRPLLRKASPPNSARCHVGADYAVWLRTIGTVLKFQVTGQKNVTKIELTGNNGEALAGRLHDRFRRRDPRNEVLRYGDDAYAHLLRTGCAERRLGDRVLFRAAGRRRSSRRVSP